MTPEEIKQLLESRLDGVEVQVEGEGCDFRLNLIGDELAAMRPVKRQQTVYQHLNEFIASGAIHAVNMAFFNREQWSARGQ
ncbi:BolA/IbaG family iron-sulfur metabolism protein [Aestuariirhabdus sp. Z084]|uniref:BolA family protein n=1 Tax=Aestuariirhabdus haliotis TaxID=2918751 RepID=UPI00201B455E|nr:BolA/IbaG family iron-sulfur metabolism protein [Aestuariirhabdus haliotis]MCL6415239.1 BolA/IbaG family iron-sulfur metabolism protein [Aestuariirhabdus haliotis]MCL6419499.1 BolA/IbaG family iron-sulfur metabolism protein [Aestuariirhabdus haliotis]